MRWERLQRRIADALEDPIGPGDRPAPELSRGPWACGRPSGGSRAERGEARRAPKGENPDRP